MGSRSLQTEAVVLRSLRFGEADRILHLFTKERGRVGAIAKGARRARSRVGGLLEPFTHVDLSLHEGRGDLATVTGVDLVRSHQALALDPYRLAVGSIGVEAVLRLFIDHDPSPRAFQGLVRFLDVLDGSGVPTASDGASVRPPAAPRPAHDPLALSFQLKLLWLAGYLPHLSSCAGCAQSAPLVAFSAAAGGGVCAECEAGATTMTRGGFVAMQALIERPLADARGVEMAAASARDVLRAIEAVYELHGGFRLRTLATG